MSSFKRRIGGKIAQSHGAYFEALLAHSAEREGFEVIRIPDGCKQLSNYKIIRTTSPFDFVFVHEHGVIFADAKTVDGDSFQYSRINRDQLKHLNKLEKKGKPAGYIVCFRTIDKVIWFDTKVLRELKPKQSLKETNGLDLGSFLSLRLSRIPLKPQNADFSSQAP